MVLRIANDSMHYDYNAWREPATYTTYVMSAPLSPLWFLACLRTRGIPL